MLFRNGKHFKIKTTRPRQLSVHHYYYYNWLAINFGRDYSDFKLDTLPIFFIIQTWHSVHVKYNAKTVKSSALHNNDKTALFLLNVSENADCNIPIHRLTDPYFVLPG